MGLLLDQIYLKSMHMEQLNGVLEMLTSVTKLYTSNKAV